MDNYTTFVNKLTDFLVATTTDTNFTTVLPYIIDYAEQRCYRDLQLLNTVTTQTSTLSTGTRTFNFPSYNGTFVVTERINVITPASATTVDGGTRNPMLPVGREYLDYAWPSSNGSTVPQYFAMLTQTTVLLGPYPDQAYLVEVEGTIRPTALSTTNLTTLLTWYFPDLFMAAAMVAGTGWERDFGAQTTDPAASQSWENQYQVLLKSAQTEEAMKKFTGEGWSAKQPAPIATPPRT